MHGIVIVYVIVNDMCWSGWFQYAMKSPELSISGARSQLHNEVCHVDLDDPLASRQATAERQSSQLLCRQPPVQAEAVLGAPLALGKVKVQQSEAHGKAAGVGPPAGFRNILGDDPRKFWWTKLLVHTDKEIAIKSS